MESVDLSNYLIIHPLPVQYIQFEDKSQYSEETLQNLYAHSVSTYAPRIESMLLDLNSKRENKFLYVTHPVFTVTKEGKLLTEIPHIYSEEDENMLVKGPVSYYNFTKEWTSKFDTAMEIKV